MHTYSPNHSSSTPSHHINFHFILSSPPNHCTPIHGKQDKHYLKWNRMNIKLLDYADWTAVFFFCLSIIAARLSLCSSSSMIKRGMSSISHADESCFLTLIRTLRGLAMGAEEHLHQTLIQQIGCFIYLFQSESTRMKMDMGTVFQSLQTII